MSPDGRAVAYIAPVDGVRNVWVAPLDDLAAARPVTRVTGRPVAWHRRGLPGPSPGSDAEPIDRARDFAGSSLVVETGAELVPGLPGSASSP